MSSYGEWQTAGEGIRRIIHPPGKGIMSMTIEFQAGAAGAAHAHPHEQITHVFAGRLAITLDGVRHEIGAGEQMYVPSDTLHSVEALEQTLVLEIFTPLRDDLLATVTDR